MALFSEAAGYDPLEDLRHSGAVGFYILGGMDRSVPTSRSVARLQQLDSSRVAVLVLPAGNHALVDARTGAPLAFGDQSVAWLHRMGLDGGLRRATAR